MSVVCPYRPPAKATANESGGFERAQLSLVSPPRGENLAAYLQYLQNVGPTKAISPRHVLPKNGKTQLVFLQLFMDGFERRFELKLKMDKSKNHQK